MLDKTDRHCRYFMRLLSRRSLLYTEMIPAAAILHGDADFHLHFDPSEQPIAVQLGGNNPEDLALSARAAAQQGYAEVNLNCGCPSNKVQQGQFGACLMLQPDLVAECVAAMRDAVCVPVTVKHRIGINRNYSYNQLTDFVGTINDAGCDTFIVHARMAWLDGISPKQNRLLPPLDYATVYRLKKDFPAIRFIINGGITSIDQARRHLSFVDGVMMGREAYRNPFILAAVDKAIFGESTASPDRHSILDQLIPYVEKELRGGARLHQTTRHILGLFHGQPGARQFRRLLSQKSVAANAGIAVLEDALQMMRGFANEQHQRRPPTDLNATIRQHTEHQLLQPIN